MKSILFVCVENRARSQIAEGLARHFVGSQYDIFSAGSKPGDRVHPMATAVMAEIGIDISKQKPKSLDTISLERIDLVITLCEEEECAVLPPHAKRLFWQIKDPVTHAEDQTAAMMRKFRKVRDELRQKILTLRAAEQAW